MLKKDDTTELQEIVRKYCHFSLLKVVNGEEGHLTNTNHYKLVQVHAVLRHGDRSTAVGYKYKPRVHIECGMMDQDTKWIGLDRFQLKPHSPFAKISQSNIKLFRGFTHQNCKMGQLTFQGFKQHYEIGTFLKDRYSKLFSNNPKHFFVQSTDFRRTIHSAAGFLLGFLPNELHESIPIHISPGSLLIAPPPGIKLTYPYCKGWTHYPYSELTNNYVNTKNKRSTIDRISKVTDIHPSKHIFFTHLFDPIWCRLCHHQPVPCGFKTCLNDSLLLEGAKLAHRSYARKHPKNLSILAIQPFLYHSVISEIDNAIKSIYKKTSYRQFVLSFGHDSTLTPLLTSLGLHKNYWLPYASRIVIELWQDMTKPTSTSSSYYVRILFNGKNQMKKLKSHFSEQYFVADDQLVQYDVWRQSLTTGKYRDLNSYINICNKEKTNK